MRQQVNLYVPELHPRREPLLFRQVAWGGGGLLLILLVIATALGGLQRSERRALLAVQAQVEQVRADVEQMSVALEGLQEDPALLRQIAQLTDAVKRRQQLVERVSGEIEGATATHFSAYLIGLARQHQPSVWLTRIDVDPAAGTLVVEGEAQQADQIPAYLQRLRAEPVYAGQMLAHFAVDALEEQGVRFVAAAKPIVSETSP